ncbi:MAG: hypothetical protein JW959_12015 [Pirellulales bacterium]|nr:hypothetical protein [Pirellulales bacterium]
MLPPENEERRSEKILKRLLDQLHDPVRLRVVVIAVVLAIGYISVFHSMNSSIAETNKKLTNDKQMISLAFKMEGLQKQYDEFKDRIPKKTDSKEWGQYMLDGIRHFLVTLIQLDCEPPKRIGPYKVIVLKISLEGKFKELNKFLHWLEANERLLRIDDISLSPLRGGKNGAALRITVLGLSG